MRYKTIVADPPWEIERVIRAGGRRARTTTVPYEFMSIDDIAALPVAKLAADDCNLFLWATRRVFREGTAATVARAWGFEPCGEIIWGLRNPGMGGHGSPITSDHEPVLIARRGSAPLDGFRTAGVWFWRQLYVNGGKAHSAKPDGFLDHVEEMSPAPRLEMFARRQRLGWDTWGNEAFNHTNMPRRAA